MTQPAIKPEAIGRLEACFAGLKSQKRAGLVTFIMAGDPDEKTTLEILRGLPLAGADIIEIGMPFSDPMADGPTIQAAGLRALQNGMTLPKILALVRAFRAEHKGTPLVLMGYYNPVYHYGTEAFVRDAAEAGVDGVILVDLPPEEEEEFTGPARNAGLHLIRLIAPTTPPARLQKLLKGSGGFVYYISVAGITGAKSADAGSLQGKLEEIRALTELPIAVGFGIRTPEQARAVAAHADAVVVGSALVDIIGGKKDADSACAFVRSLAAALRP